MEQTNVLTTSADPLTSSGDDVNDTLLSLSFNQDGGCFAVGTEYGFRICNVSPFQETFRRTFAKSKTNKPAGCNNEGMTNDTFSDAAVSPGSKSPKAAADASGDDASEITNGSGERESLNGGGGGGIGGIEMLFRCNLLALVGGGSSPHYPPNKVLIWDDRLGRPIGELSFRQRVLTVRLRRDRICVALRDRVYVYNFGNLELLDTIMTGHNGLGLLCISTDAGGSGGGVGSSNSNGGGKDDNGMVLACPSVVRGQVRVELYGYRKQILIDAHESPLAAMALTVDGSLLATASEKGTLIRLFSTGWKSYNRRHSNDDRSSTPPGVPLKEFRRGIEHAKIGSLSFSLDKCWLACASDRGTVHVFSVKKEEEDKIANGSNLNGKNSQSPKRGKKSTASPVTKLARGLLPSILTKSHILEGEHSYVQVRGIPHPKICCFVPDQPHTVAVAGLDECGNGCLLLANFGGEDVGVERDQVQLSSNQTNGSKSGKGEARRVAYHRFFKKGTGRPNREEDIRQQQHGNGDYGGTEERPLIEDCNETEAVHNEIEEIVFADDDADGFVSVETDYITSKADTLTLSSDPPTNGHNGSLTNADDPSSLDNDNNNRKKNDGKSKREEETNLSSPPSSNEQRATSQ